MFLMGRVKFWWPEKVRNFIWLVALFAVVAGLNTLLLADPALAKPKFSAIAVDARTGTVLFARDADGIRHPASLTKVMTLYVLFEDLKAGRLKLNSPLRVSKRASAMAPSKLGLKPGSTITVDQAIRALVTKSANDVAAAIAENLGGSESAFAARMTRTARSLGMSRTLYRNASGLPDPAQVTTARDLATLSLRIQRDFPQYYPYFKISAFTYKGRVIKTHNRLIGRYEGADGIKTGYIRASGFNLTSSAQRGKKRIVGVVLGAASGGARNRYMMAMLDQSFPQCKDGNMIVASVGGTEIKGAEPLQDAGEPSVSSAKKRILKGGTAQVQETAPPTATDEGDEEPSDSDVAIAEEDKSALDSMLGEPPAAIAESPPSNEIPFEVKASVESIANGSWHIQIGAYPTKSAAEIKINQARQTATKQLSDKQAFTVEVQKGNETLYRARFSGFSEGGARDVCRTLEHKGIGCLTLAPQG